MSLPDESPPLSPWPFIIADLLLMGTAVVIGLQSHAPYSSAVVIGVGLLVATGAAVLVLPFVINHARQQDLALNERQREIAALAQTLSACAEQLSIAVSSLHGIAENAGKSLKQAELLPLKLQEKIHEFKEQLNEVSLTENEALSQEVNVLRTAETERIESVVTTVRKLSGEIARLEAASRKNISDLSDSLERFTSSAGQAAANASTGVSALRGEAEKSLAAAHASALGAIEQTLHRALRGLDEKIAALQSAPLNPGLAKPASSPETLPPIDEAKTSEPVISPNGEDPASSRSPKGSHKSLAAQDSETTAAAVVQGGVKPIRKHPAQSKVAEQDIEFTLGLDLPSTSGDDFSQTSPDEVGTAAAVSADGLTRLLVTAYIGIGNKLFLRGKGPGLSEEKGVPLQFVSIGKWRWETAEADQPVRIKIFKNDELECVSLGEVVVDPGHQREVVAAF